MSFFRPKAKPTSLVQQVSNSIVAVLQKYQIDVAEAQRKTSNPTGWSFSHGSAKIEVYITQKAEKYYFQVLSPIMHIPHMNLLAFYRHLLEMNLLVTQFTFGVYGDIAYIFHERPLEGLDTQEVESLISSIALNADKFDNELVAQFGGKLYGSL